MSLFIMRHGETIWNKGQLIQGRSNIPLSEKGLNQAVEMADFFKKHNFAFVGASPLLRTQQTASLIASKLNLPVQTFDALQARNYGPWEGKSISEIKEENKSLFNRMKTWPLPQIFAEAPVEGIESYKSISERVFELFNAYTKPERDILFVTHSGVISAILLALEHPSQEVPLMGHKGHIQIRSTANGFEIQHIEGLLNPRTVGESTGSDRIFIF